MTQTQASPGGINLHFNVWALTSKQTSGGRCHQAPKPVPGPLLIARCLLFLIQSQLLICCNKRRNNSLPSCSQPSPLGLIGVHVHCNLDQRQLQASLPLRNERGSYDQDRDNHCQRTEKHQSAPSELTCIFPPELYAHCLHVLGN